MICYLWEWHSRHLAVKSDAHSLHNSVIFNRGVKSGLHCLSGGGSHHQLSILCHNLSVGDLHNVELYLLNDPLLHGRQMEFLQMQSNMSGGIKPDL